MIKKLEKDIVLNVCDTYIRLIELPQNHFVTNLVRLIKCVTSLKFHLHYNHVQNCIDA